MRHMQRQPFAARMVASVDSILPGMPSCSHARAGAHDAELLQRAGQRHNDLPRRHVVVDILLVEIELALIELKALMPPGVTTFTAMACAECMVPAT